MKLQSKTLHRYRQLFPNETLRQTSARTGIQITRVFRLFNGKNMKVGELEAFEAAILSKIAENPAYQILFHSIEEASIILTNDELGIGGEGTSHTDALTLTTGKFVGVTVDEIGIQPH